MRSKQALSIAIVAFLLLPGCLQPEDEATEPAVESDPLADGTNETQGDSQDLLPVPIPGCTKPDALNFDASATALDSSCVFRIPIDAVMLASGSVVDSVISFSTGGSVDTSFMISSDMISMHVSEIDEGLLFIRVFDSLIGQTLRVYDLPSSHVWCLGMGNDVSNSTQDCLSGQQLQDDSDSLSAWMDTSSYSSAFGDAGEAPEMAAISGLSLLLETFSSASPLVWEEALGATVDNQIFYTTTDTAPPIAIELSVNPSTARVSYVRVDFENSTYTISQDEDYDEGSVPDSQRLPMSIDWEGRIGGSHYSMQCSTDYGFAAFQFLYIESSWGKGPFLLDYGEAISIPDFDWSADCSNPLEGAFSEELASGSIAVTYSPGDGSTDGLALESIVYFEEGGRLYEGFDVWAMDRQDCADDGGSTEDDFTQYVTWSSLYDACMYYDVDWFFQQNYTAETDHWWVEYNYCEWEGGTEYGDTRWYCTDRDDGEDGFDDWWYYCELDTTEDIWHCTDDFGQSPDYEFTDGNDWYGQDGEDLGEAFCISVEGWDDSDYCSPTEMGDYQLAQTDHGVVAIPLREVHTMTFLCPDGTEIEMHEIGDMVEDCPPFPPGNDLPADEPFSFRCLNGELIPVFMVNDGSDHCPDGSDEGVEGHPDRSPEPPVMLWDCWTDILPMLRSETNPTESQYRDAKHSSPHPEWCGSELGPEWHDYEAADDQPSMDSLSGAFWINDSYESSWLMLHSNGDFDFGYSSIAQDDCNDMGYVWEEDYEICIIEAGSWGADDQMISIHGEFFGRYHLDGDFIWVGEAVSEEYFSGGPEPVPVWACYNEWAEMHEVYVEDNTGVPSDSRIESSQDQPVPEWCESEVDYAEIDGFSSDSSSESSLAGDYWIHTDFGDDEYRKTAITFSSDSQIRQKLADSSVDECSDFGGTYDPLTQVCTMQMGMTWSASETLIQAEYDDGTWSEVMHVRYELSQNGSEVYMWNAFEMMPQDDDDFGEDEPEMENTFYEGYGEVEYETFSFTAAEDGEHSIASDQDNDGYLYLYQAPFDPDYPLDGVIVSQDDHGYGSLIVWDLVSGIEYVVVTTLYGEDYGSMEFDNTITSPSGAVTEWSGSIDASSPTFIRPEGYWDDSQDHGGESGFDCHGYLIPENRTNDGFADCFDGSDEGWHLPFVASGVVGSSDYGPLNDLSVILPLVQPGSDSSIVLSLNSSQNLATVLEDASTGAITYSFSTQIPCNCVFVFEDSDGDGRASSGDWWTFWVWDLDEGWSFTEEATFYDQAADDFVVSSTTSS